MKVIGLVALHHRRTTLQFGISYLYGATGSLDLGAWGILEHHSSMFALGLTLVLVGLGFKVAAVPFHMWAPDVYEGAPFPVTAYLAIGSKAAAFALVLRLVAEGFVPAADRWDQWQLIVAVLAAVVVTGRSAKREGVPTDE